MFNLHPQLAKDCVVVGDLPLCQILLMNDQQYPWVILVPRRDNIREVFELDINEQQQLMTESNTLAAAMAKVFKAEKMNVAALGNMVPQLHIHHIARFSADAAWPKPVWGVSESVPYAPDQLAKTLQSLTSGLLSAGLDFVR